MSTMATPLQPLTLGSSIVNADVKALGGASAAPSLGTAVRLKSASTSDTLTPKDGTLNATATSTLNNSSVLTHSENVATLTSQDATRMMGATAPTTNVAAHANVAGAFGPTASALDVNTLTSAISRPLADGNGTYTVVVAMHPAELGHVQAIMSLNGSDLQVSLTPQSDHAHAALSAAVNDMRNELSRGGVNVSIDLHHPQSHTSGDTQRGPHHDTSDATPTPVTRTTAPVAESSSARDVGQINLLL